MSSAQHKKSASAAPSPVTELSNVPPVAISTGANERRQEICRTVSEAMTALSRKKSMDWTRDTPAINEAETRLEGAMFDFVLGTATREAVKKAYRQWANLHEVKT